MVSQSKPQPRREGLVAFTACPWPFDPTRGDALTWPNKTDQEPVRSRRYSSLLNNNCKHLTQIS
jgi:hypothetical protein